MATTGLLEAIRARAAARGMTLTHLARASGVLPGNLRRMFSSTTASPRLGSVMRLMMPLHCRVAPAGARTAGELAGFLDDLRRRKDLGWEQLLASTGLHADKVSANFTSAPEKVSLDLVIRLAGALHVELGLVDDDEAPTTDPGKRPAVKRSARRPTPRAEPDSPPSALTPPTSPPRESGASSQRTTALAPPEPATAILPPTSGLAPLRPPRLGRYASAPPSATPRPQQAPWTPSREPHRREAAFLSSLTAQHWSGAYAFLWGMLKTGVSLPARFLDRLGSMTAAAFNRAPPGPGQRPTQDPPAGCFDALDAEPIADFWRASRRPGHQTTDTVISYDDLGMVAFHVGVDGETAIVVRLMPRGDSHRLVGRFHLPPDEGPAEDPAARGSLARDHCRGRAALFYPRARWPCDG